MPDTVDYAAAFQEMVDYSRTIKAGVLEALAAEGLRIEPFPSNIPHYTSFGGHMPGIGEHFHCDGEDLMIMRAYLIVFRCPLADPDCFCKVAAYIKENCPVH